MLVEHGIHIEYFVNLQITTKRALNPSDSGKSVMKSIEMISNGWDGIGMDCNRPNGACRLGFAFWHMSHVATYALIARDIRGQ